MSNAYRFHGITIARGVNAVEASIGVAAKDTALLVAKLLDGSMATGSNAKIGSDLLNDVGLTLTTLLDQRHRIATQVHQQLSNIGHSVGIEAAWVGDGENKEKALAEEATTVMHIAA